MSLVAARSEPSRAVLATPQAAFTATGADSHVEMAVGRRTRIWVHSGAGRARLVGRRRHRWTRSPATPWS